jgi:SAM-dependent methyltransferase
MFAELADTTTLFERYYFSKPGFRNGTELFHGLCERHFAGRGSLLEIGAGPSNPTSNFLATLGPVTGLDVSSEVRTNSALADAQVFDGGRFPFLDASFDGCISNYVLEHVENPREHFREVARALRPGGTYVFRTPNRWHYVAMASWLLPHALHVHAANRLRKLADDAHDPWVTFYRANTRSQLSDLACDAALEVRELRPIEPEPSYGALHAALFYPMMAYERAVNFTPALGSLRANILGVLYKPDNSAGQHTYD